MLHLLVGSTQLLMELFIALNIVNIEDFLISL